jgi:diacylglycerol O-acyltransferase
MSRLDGRRPVDPVDLLLLKQESDPRRRTTMTVALRLRAAPAWDDLLARSEIATRLAPQLTQRLVSPLPGVGPPEWAHDASFDLNNHVDRITCAGIGEHHRLLETIEAMARRPLPPDRALWRATLAEDPESGAACLILRISHVLVDGLAAVQLLSCLVDVDPYSGPTALAARTGGRRLTSLGLTMERLLMLPLQNQRLALRNTLGLLRVGGSTIGDPRGRSTRAMNYTKSLARVLTQGGTAGSPALRERSADRHYLSVEVGVRELRQAARSAGGTLHDGYLAALLGGIRRYHEAHGLDVAELPMAIPVSTRSRHRGSEKVAGNRFAPVRFAAPVGLSSPAERIRSVSQTVSDARAEPALDAMTSLAPALAQFPTVAAALAGRAQDRLDIQASYVPGPPVKVFLGGERVEQIIAFGPLPGPAIMAVLLTYADRATVGFTLDAASVPDVDVFEQCMQAGFDEVLELAHPPKARRKSQA